MLLRTCILYVYTDLKLDFPLTLCMLPLFTGFSHSSGFQCGVNEFFTLLRINASLVGSWLPTFQDSLSVPYSRVKQSLTLEYGTDRLPWIVGNYLPINTACNPRRANSCHSVMPWSISLNVEIFYVIFLVYSRSDYILFRLLIRLLWKQNWEECGRGRVS